MKRSSIVVASALVLGCFAQPGQASENVALNAAVTLHGNFFVGPGRGLIVDPQTLVDGMFFPRHHPWNEGPVWWDGFNGDPFITIEFDTVQQITGFVVQADDNDAYILSYWDLDEGAWKVAWDVPNYDEYPDPFNWGLQTRPEPDDETIVFELQTPITTDALMLEGNLDDTVDALFAVSEVQAFAALLSTTVEFNPHRLNTKSRGLWITCYIMPPEGYMADEIDPDSILLEGLFEVQHSDVQGDLLMVKFDRQDLISHIQEVMEVDPPAEVTLSISGEAAGISFQGSDSMGIK